jgi:phosphoadenosine phosphosulfate reductase
MRERRSILTTAAMLEPGALATIAATLQRALRDAGPREIIAEAQHMLGRGRVTAVVWPGAGSAALLSAVAAVDPAIPVLIVDTGHMSGETLAQRQALIERLGLKDVRAITPSRLDRTLAGFDGWITGHTNEPAGAARPVVETDGLHLTFNPLAGAAREAVDTETLRSTQEARRASAPSLDPAWAAASTT